MSLSHFLYRITNPDNLDMQMTYCPPSSVFRQHTTINTKEWSINETLQFFCDKNNDTFNDTFFLGFIRRFLIKNWQKDDKQYEVMKHEFTELNKCLALNLWHLVQALGGSSKVEEYSIFELQGSRWQGNQNTLYLNSSKGRTESILNQSY